MSKNGIRYTEEFKQQIIDLYNTGSSVNDLSRKYGVSYVTIYEWIKESSPIKVSENEEITSKEYEKMKKRILTVPSKRQFEADNLKTEIRKIYTESKCRYGTSKN